MRDAGLQDAIRAVGGISALARLLGLAQPSVSIWTRVPAERVLAVESISAVPRTVLRPDLYPSSEEAPGLDPIDDARKSLYMLLSSLLIKVPGERLLIDVKRLSGDDSALGAAVNEVARLADVPGIEKIAREYFELFIGVGRGELLPYASYYRTGFLYERPLVRVRQDMKRLGIERGEGLGEPEDHLGFLLEIMAGLVSRHFVAEADEEKRFFTRHIEPWAERLFADLAEAGAAQFYRAVGKLGQEFMRIEREAFALDADIEDDGAEAPEVMGGGDAPATSQGASA